MGLQALPDNGCMNAPSLLPDIVNTPLVWTHSFHQLGPQFFTPVAPTPLAAPYWVGNSPAAAQLLGLDAAYLSSDAWLNALIGNWPLAGTRPLASVYSGHQFGQWAGQLGDGRAILLGEVAGLEVQLKGAGLTPYSRMGDGRAVLRSSIREFLCSEAMHGLGIPTSRALCVTGSDDPVRRETVETAAVVTRVAPSFIRFGHFEHFAARNQLTQLTTLADYVIDRFFPECRNSGADAGNPYAALLEAVSQRTARMVAHWQAVGFCHGVMNTDNMSILGLTIDYGPFQFLDAFVPGHICNHSDREGRYAFDEQPNIAHWNLFCLGQSLLPLIGEQDLALAALASFKPTFEHSFQQLMSNKLGLSDGADPSLIVDILGLLTQGRVDHTIFWRRLSHGVANQNMAPVRDLFLNRVGFDQWLLRFVEQSSGIAHRQQAALMLKTNPAYVLRNHLGELAIRAAKQKDFSEVAKLLKLVSNPYLEQTGCEAYADFAPDWAGQIEISCSS